MGTYLTLFCILSTSPFLLHAQLGHDSIFSDNCECVPSCSNTNIEIHDCTGGRLAPREDCSCCQVCLRQEGESCKDPQSPCDKMSGLTCSPKGICQVEGIQNLKFPKEGGTCKTDEDCPDNLFCLRDKCSDPCDSLHPCDGYLKGGECHTRHHQTKCECPKGTSANHDIKACVPPSGEPSASSTLVSLPPKVNCTVEGNTYDVGETFYSSNCQKRCICTTEGEPICGSFSCPTGLFPAGSSSHEKLCIELRNSPLADECCIVMACANDFLQSTHDKSINDDNLNALTARKIPLETNQHISEQEYHQKLVDLESVLNGGLPKRDRHEDLKNDLPNDNYLEEIELTTLPNNEPPPTILKDNFTLADRILLHQNLVGKPETVAKVVVSDTTDQTIHTTFLLHNKSPKSKTLQTSTETLSMDLTPTITTSGEKEMFETTERNLVNDQADTIESQIQPSQNDFMLEITNQQDALKESVNHDLNNYNNTLNDSSTDHDVLSDSTTGNNVLSDLSSDNDLLGDSTTGNDTVSNSKSDNYTLSDASSATETVSAGNIDNDEVNDPGTDHDAIGNLITDTTSFNASNTDNSTYITDSNKLIESSTVNKTLSDPLGESMLHLDDSAVVHSNNENYITTLKDVLINEVPEDFRNADIDSKIDSNNPNESVSISIAQTKNESDNFNQEDVSDSNTDIVVTTEAGIQDNLSDSDSAVLEALAAISAVDLTQTSKQLNETSEKIANVLEEATTADGIVMSETIEETNLTTLSAEETNEGVIREITEDGEFLHNMSFFSEMSTNNGSFREGKEQGIKPSRIPEKESKPQIKFSSKLDVIQVKVSTQNSTTLILPTSAGGIIHYKESKSDIEASKKAVSESDGNIVTITGLNPSTRYTIKWAANDGTTSKSEIKTEDGCLQSGMSYAVGTKWHEGCQTTCSCHLGGVSECRPRCIFVAGAIQDEQCEEVPSRSDPECCVEYNCKKGDNSVLDTASLISVSSGATQLTDPKLIVTSRTHNSVTVAWDDFRAGNPDSGYVTEYREVPSAPIDTKIPWMKKETSSEQPPPTMTIGQLKPNTLYEVRVGIYSNEKDRNLNAATETIKVRTEPGCVYGNTSFGVGEFFQGCEERCSCSKDGSVKCSKRCSIPYFKKGTFADDPYCTEDNEDSDDCCVLVMCAHGENRGEDQVLLDFDQCANIVCGNNAECVSWPTINDSTDGQKLPQPGSCRCKDGYSGNPSDLITGCVSDPDAKTEENSCSFKHTLYSPGDVFYDGCSYKCTCNSKRELECQPRCKFSTDEPSTDSSCNFLPDPDDSCCLIRVCNSTTVEDMKNVQPALAYDGCTYGNKTYSKNESFTFGCESKCLCMGFGDVSCFPRCPPMKEKSTATGVVCETLLDPEDECCNVTVCDDTVPDVMKANVTDAEAMNSIIEDADQIVETTTAMMEEEDSSMIVTEINGHMINETLEFESRIRQTDVNATDVDEENSTMKEVDEPAFVKETIYQTGNEENTTDSLRSIHFPDHTTMLPTDIIDEETVNSTQRGKETEMIMKKPRFEGIMIPKIEIEEIAPVDSSTVKMTVKVSQAILHKLLSSPDEFVTVTYSHDSLKWKNRTIAVDDIGVENMYDIVFEVPNLGEFDAYQFRVIYDDFVSPISKASLTSSAVSSDPKVIRHDSCEFKGRFYKAGENFYDDCVQFCQCNDGLKVHCGYIECPEHFGLDILDPGCLEWVDDPEYVPVPPRCCGNKPKCAMHINDLSCNYEGHVIKHLDFVPRELTECDQRCQCMRGTLECESLCSPVPATPPFHLDCHPSEAQLITRNSVPCCREWQCMNNTDSDGFIPMPKGPHPHEVAHINMPGPPAPPPAISMPITHLSEDGLHIYFNIPNTFVGLPGGIYLRYTPDIVYNPNPLDWESEVIHEDGVTLDQAQWQYVKRNLVPGTNYTMQLVLSSHVSKSEIVSPDFVISTPPGKPEEVMVPTELSVEEITNKSVKISWAPFAKRNLQYIDSIHVAYWPRSEKTPNYGPLLEPNAASTVLDDLKPRTKYAAALMIIVHEGSPVHLLSHHNVTFETLPDVIEQKTTPLPHLDLDAELSVSDVQNTSVKISWKNFDEFELQYIDGIRVRFWPENKRFPEEGPMLHREADNMILRDLEPGTKYVVDLFFIPHEGLTSTISNTKNITFTTLPKLKDKYAFNITIAAGDISEDGVQILYSGVAEPEGKYINVYRVVYTSDGDSEDSHKFKVPKNQKDGYIMLTDLKSGIKYEVWLEAYLTNGGKKKSNVITVETSYGQSLQPEKSEIIKSKELRQDGDVSYYSAFVAVAILVAIACLIIIGLLFVLMRRQNHAKAHINSSKGVAAYDNPSYKTSENNYAIEMNGLKNTTNGNSLQADEP